MLPPIEIKDFSGIKVTRPVFDVPEAEIEEQVQARSPNRARIRAQARARRSSGDRVTIDYVGKVDGEAFDGGAG